MDFGSNVCDGSCAYHTFNRDAYGFARNSTTLDSVFDLRYLYCSHAIQSKQATRACASIWNSFIDTLWLFLYIKSNY
jgi:hypothetical protein